MLYVFSFLLLCSLKMSKNKISKSPRQITKLSLWTIWNVLYTSYFSKAPAASLGKFGCGSAKFGCYYKFSFLWWLSLSKTSKALTNFFHSYWWSKNPAIWLEKNTFCSCNCLHSGKTLSIWLQLISLLLSTIFNLTIPRSQPKTQMENLWKLGYSWSCLATPSRK